LDVLFAPCNVRGEKEGTKGSMNEPMLTIHFLLMESLAIIGAFENQGG